MTNSMKAKYLHNLCASPQYNTSLKDCLQMVLIMRHVKYETNENSLEAIGSQ